MRRNGMVVYNGEEISTKTVVGSIAEAFEQPNYRPDDPKNRFPMMMYKAQKGSDGVVRVEAGRTLPREYFPNDHAYEAALKRDELFTQSCQQEIGRDPNTGGALPREQCEAQYKQAIETGWREKAQDAIDLVMHYEMVIKGEAHIQRLRDDARMSDKAKAEAAAKDASTPDILAEIPEQKREHWKTRQAREKKEKANVA